MGEPDNTFRLPDLGEGLTQAEVVAWHVQPGDHVVADQPLLAVETDKAIADIPAPRAGRLAEIVADVGALVSVGDVLFVYADSDEQAPVSVSVVGDLDTGASPAPIKATPRARQRARELGVALADLTPSGPDGVVQLEDVASAATGAATMSPVRRAMAERMTAANTRVVRATVTGEADVTHWQQDARTLLRLIRAVGRACVAQPLLNAHFDDSALRLSPQDQVHLGIAMESADGLFVPVLRDVNGQEPEALAANLVALQTAVEARSIAAAELRGQTITLSNFGAVGGLHAEMVVVPPQVAIVGAGRAFERVKLSNGTPEAHRVLPLSITFDHRAVTGAEACEFLNALIQDLELTD